MPYRFVVGIVVLAAGLSGCNPNRYCMKDYPYQSAVELPAVVADGELAVADSSAALRIPPAPATALPFGAETEDGAVACLDKPPAIDIGYTAEQLEAKPEEKSRRRR